MILQRGYNIRKGLIRGRKILLLEERQNGKIILVSRISARDRIEDGKQWSGRYTKLLDACT